MRELERKQRLKRRLYSVPALIAMLLVTVLLGKAAYLGLERLAESKAYRENLEVQVANLTQREVELEHNINRLQTEEGLKEEIKGKFNVSEEGEYMAVIVDARNISTTTEEDGEGWLARMWNAIIGR